MRCLLCTLAFVLFVGCRTSATGVANPFLAPDRVPPPATRTQLPGTAQPYYPGDPVPNISIGGAPPYQPAPTFAPQPVTPQPAGVVPPGGWNTPPQTYPRGATNVLPGNVLPASAMVPVPIQQPIVQQPIVQSPIAQPRQVRIRAISSEGLDAGGSTGVVPSGDGFRPQGSRSVRKPTTDGQVVPRLRERGPVREASDRFGYDPNYQWIRGQLQHSSATGEWTLRYVPIQGGVDQFGGNLTIANRQVLGNLEPGDFVLLRGRLLGTDAGATLYTVSVVQRQRI